MQNTDYCQFCDKNDRTRTVKVLGKNVTVKNYICSEDGINYRKKPENVRLQLSVCPTAYCPAGCRFCIAQDTKSRQRIDTEKFAKTMELLHEEDRVRGVKITGGEPFYDIGLLNETVSILYGIFGHSLELSISTNGMGLDKLHEIKDLKHIDTIHISRHHYDDMINKSIFGGADVPSGKKLKEIVSSVSFKDIFVFNCMLLKDYINSPDEAHKMLDFSIETGVPKVGFMTCSPINGYATEQFVAYESVLNRNDRSLLFTRGFFDYDYCHCTDGVYLSPGGNLIEFYGRSTSDGNCRYSRGLVFDADSCLRDGFRGKIII